MSFQQMIWSLDHQKPLENADLSSENELENLICKDISVLNKNWLVINHQVKTAAGKFIDILCVDHDGDMVVVELKKDLTPREVTAQVIDYAASVSNMPIEDIAQEYLKFTDGKETLGDVYQHKFGISLEESNINQNVKMVIVASQMDSGTERIIRFLRNTYLVDINILFFRVYQCGDQRIISRTWFEEDIEELPPESQKKRSWNGECYISFGEGHRKWEDAKKYGFISAGGGSWYTRPLNSLSPNDRIWVYIPKTGYVGVGIVTEPSQSAKSITFPEDGIQKKLSELSLQGDYLYSSEDPDSEEHIVKVKWIHTVNKQEAVNETGFFCNQNIVCRSKNNRWDFTVSRLKELWNITD